MKGCRVVCLLTATLVMLPGAAWTLAQPQRDTGSNGSQSAAVHNRTVYDGNWWLKADSQERVGFLHGLRDYLIAGGEKWLVGSPEYGDAKIAAYYTRDARSRSLPVAAVWRSVLDESPPPKPGPGAEIWGGPHGYYLGRWYVTSPRQERLGYLEGYLRCPRTYGNQPASDYPMPLEYYDQKILKELEGQGPAWEEPIAGLLARFRSTVRN